MYGKKTFNRSDLETAATDAAEALDAAFRRMREDGRTSAAEPAAHIPAPELRNAPVRILSPRLILAGE